MATSALDLMAALDARLADLEATMMIPGSIPRVRQEWRALAGTSLRLLQSRPRRVDDSAQRLELLLGSMAAAPDEHPLPEPGTGLMAITRTIGCAAEVMRTPTITGPATRIQASDTLRANVKAALARAARWTERGFLALDWPPDPQIIRLAGLQAEPAKSPALQAWRVIGSTDPGIDGAASRWETAASVAVTDPRAVTQLALQLAAADIALLCAATSAVAERAHETLGMPDGGRASAALVAAGRSWRQAARWPSHVRLGGRSTQLRHASADLRQSLNDALRSGGNWKQPEELFTDASPEVHLAVLHSALQSAIRVGGHVSTALDDQTRGASRVWLDAGHVLMPKYSVQEALDSLRWGWLPDPATYHSAEPLHHAATGALTRLVQATPLAIETLAAQPSQPDQDNDDDGLWETVAAPPIDYLHAAQARANLIPVPLADPAGPTISR